MDNYIDAFVEICIQRGRREFEASNEAGHRRELESQMDEMLDTNLTQDQRMMVDEVLQRKSAMHKADEKRLYQQGIKDCVAVLKEWGVLL